MLLLFFLNESFCVKSNVSGKESEPSLFVINNLTPPRPERSTRPDVFERFRAFHSPRRA
jgi:hypothetical protein